MSLTTNEIPLSWKSAVVTPLPKGGDSSNVTNLRPISQLPIPGKILERIIHTKISEHLDLNHILLDEQGGYRKSCSTIDTISKLTNDILRNRNIGNITLAAFIDIKKAFDSVNYLILIEKLKLAGIRGEILNWIKNYLTHRTQKTEANNKISEPADLTCGVPQGSILGPLFFLIYINDINTFDDGVKTLLYADDSVLYVSGRNLDDLERKLQHSMTAFINWSVKNKLTLNESKTKLMIFASSRKLPFLHIDRINIQANGQRLRFVDTFRYLGVTLDSELNMTAHLKELKKLVGYKSYLLNKLKGFIPTETMLFIYKVYALPLFDYGDILYANSNVDMLDLLQRVQNRCLKYCLKLPRLTSTDYVHQVANIPKLEDRRVYHQRVYGYKRAQNPQYIDNRLRVTRAAQAPVLFYSLIHAASYERSIEVSVARAWNDLHHTVRNTENISQFKALMKVLLEQTIPVNQQP